MSRSASSVALLSLTTTQPKFHVSRLVPLRLAALLVRLRFLRLAGVSAEASLVSPGLLDPPPPNHAPI